VSVLSSALACSSISDPIARRTAPQSSALRAAITGFRTDTVQNSMNTAIE
jgi:hypothetical protein